MRIFIRNFRSPSYKSAEKYHFTINHFGQKAKVSYRIEKNRSEKMVPNGRTDKRTQLIKENLRYY